MNVHQESQELENLWSFWRTSRAPDDLYPLLDYYKTWLFKISSYLYSRYFVAGYELNDYVHWGTIGLIESIQRYESINGATFETYAYRRVRGEVLNNIKKMTEEVAQKSYISKLEIKERFESLSQSKNQSEFEKLYAVTTGLMLGFLIEQEFYEQSMPGELANDVYSEQLNTNISTFIARLSATESTLLQFHYFNHLSFAEIATIMGKSKGRISQVHAQAIEKMRLMIKEANIDLIL